MAKTKTHLAKSGKTNNAKRSHRASRTHKSPRKSVDAGNTLVTIDRRTNKDRREESEHHDDGAEHTQVEHRHFERRAKVNRRRQIDPTTCERDYTDDEIEFMNALDQYKRTSGRMFPTCSEVLEVIRSLGYHKKPIDTPPALVTGTAEPPAAELTLTI